MAILISRVYAGARDLQSMLDLLVAVRPAARLSGFPSMVDLRELLALRCVQDNTRLWLDMEGRVVGFAVVDHYDNLWFEFDQQDTRPNMESEIVDWGMACIQRATQEGRASSTLDGSCRSDDTARISLFERRGFVLQEIRSLHLVRPLDEPIPTPQVPPGFTIRHVAGENEVEALVALHRAAFGTENLTVEERLSMMRVPEYDPELDLLAVAPDGRLAAYCMCSISQEENQRSGLNEGYTDPVATHPDFQRRKLARALLLTGLHKLRQRAVGTAVLGTRSDNPAMLRVAQSVGFRVQATTLWFSKPVSQNRQACAESL